MTLSTEYPLPTIHKILEQLIEAKALTTMDREQGFHQMRMAEGGQFKTAFKIIIKQRKCNVMPFGLRGTPETSQPPMSHMFFDYIGKGTMIYMDDILVYSKDKESHAGLLAKILKLL